MPGPPHSGCLAQVRELVEQGLELGDADDLVFGESNSKQQNGAVGLLTDNVETRTSLYEQAVVLALIPFKTQPCIDLLGLAKKKRYKNTPAMRGCIFSFWGQMDVDQSELRRSRRMIRPRMKPPAIIKKASCRSLRSSRNTKASVLPTLVKGLVLEMCS